MNIRFAAENFRLGLSRGFMFWKPTDAELSPYQATGLACAHVDDRYGPPQEWGFLDTKDMWRMERTPLLTTVFAVPDELWTQRFADEEVSWPSQWMVGEQGTPLDADVVKMTLRSHAKRVAESYAIVYYVPPPEKDEYSSFRDRLDAELQITLRMSAAGMAQWNELGQRYLGADLFPLTISVSHIYFAHSDAASADTGSPTWRRFIGGHLSAPAYSGFSIRGSSRWDDLEE